MAETNSNVCSYSSASKKNVELEVSVVSLYPAEDHANLENILELIQAHHISPVSDEIGKLPQPVENNQESNMDIMMTPGRKVRRHTKNAKKSVDFWSI